MSQIRTPIRVEKITLTNYIEPRGQSYTVGWGAECTVRKEPLTKATANGDTPEEALANLRHAIAEMLFQGKLTDCEPGCIYEPTHTAMACDVD